MTVIVKVIVMIIGKLHVGDNIQEGVKVRQYAQSVVGLVKQTILTLMITRQVSTIRPNTMSVILVVEVQVLGK